MDEDVLARAEIEVPGLEILEEPAKEDEIFEEVVGGTAIMFSALGKYKKRRHFTNLARKHSQRHH